MMSMPKAQFFHILICFVVLLVYTVVTSKAVAIMDNKNIFASNLKKYMNLNGKSRREVSDALGVSYYTFSDWVNGKKYPRMDKVEMLANYFGIKKSDLIEEKVTPEMQKNSDIMVDITIRIGSDIGFRNVVKRNCYDKNFFELSEMLCELSDEQLQSVKSMLGTFFKQAVDVI